ncbi:MAG: histidine ammonia-lyase [Planctomycetes bacterium TMED75]|nr:histidine ammonia-lyase [Planctomycetaceae bacterium]OUU90033.1 MAG: histidine ammonia-lyase [Planctomycetes bacterium TMED75]
MNARQAHKHDPVVLDGSPLSTEEVRLVAREHASAELSDGARTRVVAARQVVADAAEDVDPVYGLNTGFGSLSKVRVTVDQVHEIQRNIVRSHAAGVGDPLPKDVVRATMLILAASLARGHSGVEPSTIDRLLWHLEEDVVPVVPSRGSVGASGDLAPLSHIALALIGEGECRRNEQKQPTRAFLDEAGLEPITLEAKEGLALLNGTHLMAATGALCLEDAHDLLEAAIAGTALSLDACRASHGPFDPRIHELRTQHGQIEVARRVLEQLVGSQIVEDHQEDDPRVQDPYCLRAASQVLGAGLDAIAWVRTIIERELGAVTDNPLVFPADQAILSGGNFHGMPLAIALDTLRIALVHVAGISERRVFWVLSGHDTENPVTTYLAPEPGLHSGYMIAQYTAAACCNELQTLANPASVANVPTSAGIEDYNSMGATSANLARQSIRLARDVVAIELLVMTEAMEHQRPLRSGTGVESTVAKVREVVPPLKQDRPPAPDIARIAELIAARGI